MKRVFRYLIGAALVLMSQSAMSQDVRLNYSLGGGVEMLRYTPDIGESQPGGGVSFLWQYQQFFTKHFGYGVGLGISYFTANYHIDETIEQEIVDETDAGRPYILRTIFDDFNEKQKTLQLEVPLGLYLRLRVSENSRFIIGGGPKVDFPLICKFDYTEGSVETRAYFGGDIDAELRELPQHGLYVQKPKESNRIDREVALLSVYADMLWTYRFNNSSIIHLGAYFSYGISDMVSNHDAVMGVERKSILNSTLTEKVVPVCIGLKVGVTVPYQGGGGGRSSFDGY